MLAIAKLALDGQPRLRVYFHLASRFEQPYGGIQRVHQPFGGEPAYFLPRGRVSVEYLPSPVMPFCVDREVFYLRSPISVGRHCHVLDLGPVTHHVQEPFPGVHFGKVVDEFRAVPYDSRPGISCQHEPSLHQHGRRHHLEWLDVDFGERVLVYGEHRLANVVLLESRLTGATVWTWVSLLN